jgi:hypothetical protein
MKKLTAILASLLIVVSVMAQSNPHSTAVKGYTKKNGTYVEPSHRTAPNHTQRDNYSTKGNTNTYTGKSGTRTPKN